MFFALGYAAWKTFQEIIHNKIDTQQARLTVKFLRVLIELQAQGSIVAFQGRSYRNYANY